MTKTPSCVLCGSPSIPTWGGRKCRKCLNEISKKRYYANRESILLRQKEYVRKNISSIYQKNRNRSALKAREEPMLNAFYQARSRSKKNKIPFSIKFSDVPEVPEFCPVLGIPLTPNSGKRTDSSPSLDKIIPSLGYVPGNVDVISFRANTLKNSASLEELVKIVQYLKLRT